MQRICRAPACSPGNEKEKAKMGEMATGKKDRAGLGATAEAVNLADDLTDCYTGIRACACALIALQECTAGDGRGMCPGLPAYSTELLGEITTRLIQAADKAEEAAALVTKL